MVFLFLFLLLQIGNGIEELPDVHTGLDRYGVHDVSSPKRPLSEARWNSSPKVPEGRVIVVKGRERPRGTRCVH